MVQMKDNPLVSFILNTVNLYIPHGSDERSFLSLFEREAERLYIPHGSDESALYLVHPNVAPQLYIPHGSDESAEHPSQ